MTEKEIVGTLSKKDSEFELTESKKARRKKSYYAAALVLAVLTVTGLAYGFANGYFQVSSEKSESRADDLRKQTEKLQSEIAEISKQKEIMEQKRAKILEQLEKTKILVEQSKNSSTEIKAHIEVVSSSCLSCPTPAWIQAQKKVFDNLEEIEKILNENNLNASAR